MKKITTILIAGTILGSTLMAGNSTQAIPNEDNSYTNSTSGFYLGGGYGMLTTEFGGVYPENYQEYVYEIYDYGEVMVNAGYKFNQYIAMEVRYWLGVETEIESGVDASVTSVAMYAKPQYPVTPEFNLYALVGIATSELTLNNSTAGYAALEGFSYGVGASYNVTKNVSLFMDYVSLYDEESYHQYTGVNFSQDNDAITTFNFGLNYLF